MLTLTSGPNHALLERIAFLEGRLAEYANAPPSPNSGDGREHYNHGYYSTSPPSSQGDRRSSIADVVGFISLGGEPAYVGSSSGFAMATNLGQMAGATVWNKALASAVSRKLQIKNSYSDPNLYRYELFLSKSNFRAQKTRCWSTE